MRAAQKRKRVQKAVDEVEQAQELKGSSRSKTVIKKKNKRRVIEQESTDEKQQEQADSLIETTNSQEIDIQEDTHTEPKVKMDAFTRPFTTDLQEKDDDETRDDIPNLSTLLEDSIEHGRHAAIALPNPPGTPHNKDDSRASDYWEEDEEMEDEPEQNTTIELVFEDIGSKAWPDKSFSGLYVDEIGINPIDNHVELARVHPHQVGHATGYRHFSLHTIQAQTETIITNGPSIA